MQSYIVSNDQCSIINSPDILVITPEKSIGIDEVRLIQHFLAKKPIQSEKNIVYIKDAHLLTIPAQNALLKILEEPPGNSEIYLVTDQPDQLLPTILSRCQITFTPRSLGVVGPINPKEFDLNTITTREQALDFLDGVEMYLHQNPQTPTNYQTISECRKYLKANVNVKLCLDFLCYHI
ncbi:MAG: hypothetical protein Q8L51_03030 [Candidatus Amesbacteria bacterium]|nr:hypothetical protein [Candidatus Amesbacteria bacterium]